MIFLHKSCTFICFLTTPHSIQDLSSPSRGQTHAPCSGSVVLTTGQLGKFQDKNFIIFPQQHRQGFLNLNSTDIFGLYY